MVVSNVSWSLLLSAGPWMDRRRGRWRVLCGLLPSLNEILPKTIWDHGEKKCGGLIATACGPGCALPCMPVTP
jgi:hypothetical protein